VGCFGKKREGWNRSYGTWGAVFFDLAADIETLKRRLTTFIYCIQKLALQPGTRQKQNEDAKWGEGGGWTSGKGPFLQGGTYFRFCY